MNADHKLLGTDRDRSVHVPTGTRVRLVVGTCKGARVVSCVGDTGRVDGYNNRTGFYRVRLDRPVMYLHPTVLVERDEFEVQP